MFGSSGVRLVPLVVLANVDKPGASLFNGRSRFADTHLPHSRSRVVDDAKEAWRMMLSVRDQPLDLRHFAGVHGPSSSAIVRVDGGRLF